MPAQPPFLTPTRRPATGLSEAAMVSRTRAAAASVSVITLNLERIDPIGLSFDRVQGPVNEQQYSNEQRPITGLVTHADRPSPAPAGRRAAPRRPSGRPRSRGSDRRAGVLLRLRRQIRAVIGAADTGDGIALAGRTAHQMRGPA